MTHIDRSPACITLFGRYRPELSRPPRDLRFGDGDPISLNNLTGQVVIGETIMEWQELSNDLKECIKENGGRDQRAIVEQRIAEIKAYRWEGEPGPSEIALAQESLPKPEELETTPSAAAEPDPAANEASDDTPERPVFPEPWRDHLEICIDAWFRYCDLSGIVSLRSFDQNDKGKPPFRITPTSLKGGLKFLMEAAEDDARRAAYNPKPIVFCPPIATFTNPQQAGEKDLFEGPVLSVDLDKNPRAALAMLERLLGPATLVVRSGGVWVNPETGEDEDKLHAHWRLKKPARGEDLKKLKEARRLATILVDGDRNNIPISHPLRWPGSWHRKGAPRLCEIVSPSEHLDNEIDLDLALAILQENTPKAAVLPFKSGNEAQDFTVAENFRDLRVEDAGDSPHADPKLIAAALAVIPHNDNDPHSEDYWTEIKQTPGRDYMVRIGMAVKAECGEAGLTLFDNWRSGAPDYHPDIVKKKWEGFHPTDISVGTIFYYANIASPGWRDGYEARAESTNEKSIPGFDVSSSTTTPQPQQKPQLIVELGSKLWGPATKGGTEYRFGADHSKVIDPRKGAWFDFATNEGGFIKDLMKKVEAATEPKERVHWTVPPLIYRSGKEVPIRNFLYANAYARGFASCTVADGGVGKSILRIAELLAMATGRNILGIQPAERLRCAYWNGDDPYVEVERRIHAVCEHHNINLEQLVKDGWLHIATSDKHPLCVAEMKNGSVNINQPALDDIYTFIRDHNIGVASFDPLKALHRVPENDNTFMDVVAAEFNLIAERTNSSIALDPHIRKPATGQNNEVTIADARGATALINKVRLSRVCNPMTPQLAATARIKEENRGFYFRVDKGKGNISPPAKATWFQIIPVPCSNGQDTPTVIPWTYPNVFDQVSTEHVHRIRTIVAQAEYRKNSQSENWVGIPVADMLGLDLEEKTDKKQVKEILEVWFKNGVLDTDKKTDDNRHKREFVKPGSWNDNINAPPQNE